MKPNSLKCPIQKGREHLEALLEQGYQSPVIDMEAADFFNRLRERALNKQQPNEG